MTTTAAGTVAAPSIDRRTLTKWLEGVLPATDQTTCPLVLVEARYNDSHGSVQVTPRGAGGLTAATYRVTVTDQPSVLGVIDAWQQHRAQPRDSLDVLVVTTTVGDELGWELRSQALNHRVLPVDRAVIVRTRFQAEDIDPRLLRAPWLVDALLDAEPATGWPPAGPLLTMDTAIGALVSARLGLDGVTTGGLDTGALLAWSRVPGAPDRFARLAEDERAGIGAWLAERAGPGTSVVLALAGAGRGQDAMALGVVSAVVAAKNGAATSADAALALGSLLGGVSGRPAELRALAEAVQGTVTRWVAEAASRDDPHSEAAGRVWDVARRADVLAAQAGITDALRDSPVLPSALTAQLRSLATALSAAPDPTRPSAELVAVAEAGLNVVEEHHLSQLDPRRTVTARMAVRLQRWLATTSGTAAPVTGPVVTVAAGVEGHLADWGWVDRALDVVWTGDSAGDVVLGQAYRRLHDAARARRAGIDEAFADRLVPWAAHARSVEPAGALLIEDVLGTVVAPLAGSRSAPLVLVLDGMSSSVAIELGEQLHERGWIETSPFPGRRAAAVAVLPTITQVSRSSLLSGALVAGGQSIEEAGFTAFWKGRGRTSALFHKGDLAGPAGHRLADEVIQALAGPGVVAVVLNTIDDALDHGPESDYSGWRLGRIKYLNDLLDAARAYGRPVVLVADHGHVLDRSSAATGPTPAAGVEAARWRIGTPGPGEVLVAGPRVLAAGGRVVLPWSEDVRYTPRKAGYHGGAALAEVTVPVLVMLPALGLMPGGWGALIGSQVTPPWWTGRPPATGITDVDVVGGTDAFGVGGAVVARGPGGRGRKVVKPPQGDSLFDVAPDETPEGALAAVPPVVQEPSAWPPPERQQPRPTGASSAGGSAAFGGLGVLVVGSDTYAAQKAFVRKAPEKEVVAAVIDALAAASGTLPLSSVAIRAGRAGRSPEFLVTTLQRLLNVEGYQVLGLIDAGRTVSLDVTLLRQQFGIGGQPDVGGRPGAGRRPGTGGPK